MVIILQSILLKYNVINYCMNSDMSDYNKLIQLHEKLTDTIEQFYINHNAKYQ